jgi:hypothetical protein
MVLPVSVLSWEVAMTTPISAVRQRGRIRRVAADQIVRERRRRNENERDGMQIVSRDHISSDRLQAVGAGEVDAVADVAEIEQAREVGADVIAADGDGARTVLHEDAGRTVAGDHIARSGRCASDGDVAAIVDGDALIAVPANAGSILAQTDDVSLDRDVGCVGNVDAVRAVARDDVPRGRAGAADRCGGRVAADGDSVGSVCEIGHAGGVEPDDVVLHRDEAGGAAGDGNAAEEIAGDHVARARPDGDVGAAAPDAVAVRYRRAAADVRADVVVVDDRSRTVVRDEDSLKCVAGDDVSSAARSDRAVRRIGDGDAEGIRDGGSAGGIGADEVPATVTFFALAMLTPFVPLPEMTFCAFALVDPTCVFDAPLMSMPLNPFPNPAVPAAFVPMKLSLIVVELPVTRMPDWKLPEMTLPNPSLPRSRRSIR